MAKSSTPAAATAGRKRADGVTRASTRAMRKPADQPQPIDATDERIIAAVRKDGRISNRDLAKAAAVNEATVRSRIRRLEDSETLRIVGMIDLAAAGFDFLAAVGIQVRGRPVVEVAEDLARIDRILTVIAVIGQQDLEIQVVAREMEELSNLLTNVIANVPGVTRLTPGLATRILKYDAQWVPFL